MKKVLLFGATGMAGHVVYYYLQSTGKYDISNVVYRTPLTEDSIIVDVTNRDAVADVVHRVHPEIIINCVGILIKGSREHPDNAILINAYFPHLLKRLSDEVGAKLIHISTDCVFSGKKGNYTEDDFRDADDVYGRSKALGEIINDKDLTIRTSIFLLTAANRLSRSHISCCPQHSASASFTSGMASSSPRSIFFCKRWLRMYPAKRAIQTSAIRLIINIHIAYSSISIPNPTCFKSSQYPG